MTITDIARMMMNADRYSRGVAQPKYPNGAAVSHPDRPYDGLDITGMTVSDRKVVPVSKEAEKAVRDMALEDMKKYYGMSGPDGNNLGQHRFLTNVLLCYKKYQNSSINYLLSGYNLTILRFFFILILNKRGNEAMTLSRVCQELGLHTKMRSWRVSGAVSRILCADTSVTGRKMISILSLPTVYTF